MSLKLYDLALGDSSIRPSPYCWLVKFGLLHKGLEFETAPLGFTEKDKYPDPEHGKLPILQDGEEMICDSAAIIAYLEEKYPGAPSYRDELRTRGCQFLQCVDWRRSFSCAGADADCTCSCISGGCG